MSVRPDFEDMANNLGCAPNAAMRTVEIARDVFEEFQALAKRTHCSPETAINAALAEWLGRV